MSCQWAPHQKNNLFCDHDQVDNENDIGASASAASSSSCQVGPPDTSQGANAEAASSGEDKNATMATKRPLTGAAKRESCHMRSQKEDGTSPREDDLVGQHALEFEADSEDDADAPPDAAQGPKRVRRDGLPVWLLVLRHEDKYQLLEPCPKRNYCRLAEVVLLRERKLEALSLPRDGILAEEHRRSVVRGLYEAWLASEDPAKLEHLWKRSETNDAYHRTLRSNWRRHCFSYYGGLEWLHLFVATGEITDAIIGLVNAHIDSVIERGRTDDVDSPRLSERKRSLRDGSDRPPPLCGVRHRISPNKRRRQEIKGELMWIEKDMAKMDDEWKRNRSQWAWNRWERRSERRQELLREQEAIKAPQQPRGLVDVVLDQLVSPSFQQ